ncbi:MerR family DNA-binding transcriptional regulator [Planctomycetales bacterium ZRK34]|nr:MerR family DNA-binding transcriptional regulator [Planctomycetales bacterium ZRK34]
MDELDRQILDGSAARLEAGAAARLGRHLQKPLRTHALVLRAGDRRWIPGIPVSDDAERIELEGHEVRAMCEPVFVPPPGLTMRQVARKFGVSVNTIRRWEKRGLVVVRRFDGKHQARSLTHSRDLTGRGSSGPEDARAFPYARRFPKLNMTLVYTPYALDPGGEVWQMPWGFVRRYLYERVDDSFYQELVRVRRRIGAQGGMWQWICPRCGQQVFKVYLAMGPWTARHYLGNEAVMIGERFACRRCAELVYESAECTEAWDRFVQRLSGGLMRGEEVGDPTQTAAHEVRPVRSKMEKYGRKDSNPQPPDP